MNGRKPLPFDTNLTLVELSVADSVLIPWNAEVEVEIPNNCPARSRSGDFREVPSLVVVT